MKTNLKTSAKVEVFLFFVSFVLVNYSQIYKEHAKALHLIVISSVLRLLSTFSPLISGEAYYARGAKSFELSYFDQPPLFLWLSGVFVKIFGYNNFALRFPSVLLFAGTTWLLYLLTIKIYKNKNAAYWAALFLNISPVFTVSIGLFFQPDSPLIFFWLLSFYAVHQILFPQNEITDLKLYRKSAYTFKWFLILGIALGLTALSKYHVAFLVFGVLIFAFSKKKYWHWFGHYGFYFSTFLAILIFLPVIFWNAQNDWISFVFQSTRASVTETELHWEWFFRSLGGQAMWVSPWIWLPLVFQVWILARNKMKNAAHALLFWVGVPVIVFFTVVTLWSDLQFHFHWQAPGYLMLFIPLGFWIENLAQKFAIGKLISRISMGISIITITILGAIFLHIETGFWKNNGPKWLSEQMGQKSDPTIFINDFEQVKDKFEQNKWFGDTTIFAGSTRWWFSGLVDYSMKAEKDFIIFSDDSRNYAFLINPRKLVGKNCILVQVEGYEDNIPTYVSPFFDKIEKVDSCYIERYEGEKAEKVYFFFCKNFHQSNYSVLDMPLYAQLDGKKPFEILTKFKKDSIVPRTNWEIIKTNEKLTVYSSSFEPEDSTFRSSELWKGSSRTGKHSAYVSINNPFSEDLVLENQKNIEKIKVQFYYKTDKDTKVIFVASFEPNDKSEPIWLGHKFELFGNKQSVWEKSEFEIGVSELPKCGSKLKLYFWDSQPSGSIIWLDDIEIQVQTK